MVGSTIENGRRIIMIETLNNTICESAAGCMAPCAMLMSGYVLGGSHVKEMFMNTRVYIASILRLILIPGMIGVVMYVLRVNPSIMLCAVAILAMPLGLNTVVFPEAFGGDSQTGAQACFISSVLGLFTMPVVFSLLTAVTLH